MPLSWNEIKSRSVTFSKEWENETLSEIYKRARSGKGEEGVRVESDCRKLN